MIEQTHANDEYLLNLIKNQTTIAEDLHKILKTQKETIDFQMSQAYMGEVSQPRGGIPKFFFFNFNGKEMKIDIVTKYTLF
jgi:hypothetical protein